MPVRPALLATLAVAGLAAAACGSSGSSRAASAGGGSTTTAMSGSSAGAPAAANSAGGLHTASVPGVGTVLVDGSGRTVYLFEPDARSKPTCSGNCAVAWPPVAGPVSPGAGVQSSLVGKVSGPNGEQATYNGWPLYTFSRDTGPGQAQGQGVQAFGGYWYVLNASGSAVSAGGSASAPSSSTQSGSGSGYGNGSYGSGGSSGSGGY